MYKRQAELGLPGLRTDVPGTARITRPERDHADHRSVAFGHEGAGAPAGHLGHVALQLVTRPGATEMGAHLHGGEQLDERQAVPGLGLAEHEPLGP